jgi:uncharacterized protein (DUF1330 family)
LVIIEDSVAQLGELELNGVSRESLKSNTPKKKLKEPISRKDDMKKGYWVVAYRSISDQSAPKAYAELAVPALQPFGARFLTMRSSKVYPHESGLQQGTVVVEFDSYETALAAYESEAYKKALQALGSGAERDFRIVEGV